MTHQTQMIEPYIIRHKFDGDEKDLCDAGRIAIWFENRPIDAAAELPPDVRGAYRTALNYMIQLRDRGGYVFAEYGDGYIGESRIDDIGCLLARIEPQGKFDAFTVNGSTYNVTLKLDPSSIGYIRYSAFPVLLAIRPPFSTICRPRRTYPQIATAFFSRAKISAIDASELLHPKMVEQLCVEYLRQKGHNDDKLDYCMLRPGKSLAIVDIAGRLRSSKKLFAQVKNTSLSEEYASELAGELDHFIGKSEREDAVGVLFGRFKGTQNYEGPISFVDLGDVIRYFRERQETILNDMIGIGAVETGSGAFSIDVDWTK